MPPQPSRVSLAASASAPSFGYDSEEDGGLSSLRPGRAAMLNQKQTRDAGNPSPAVGLYGVPSFGSVYEDVEDLEPGPGSYDIPHSFGQQHLSHRISQPLTSITAKHDSSWSKVMISKDHLSTLMARGTPGPGTYNPALVPTQARVRFSDSKRRSLSDTHFRAPGPVYDIPGSEGARKTVKFGKANRFDEDNQSLSKLLGSTGPGQYEVTGFTSEQKLSKSFGASHRAYDRVRFPGSDRVGIGMASPGPGALQPFQNSGKTNAFGRAERLPTDTHLAKRAPGPGAYDHHEKPCPHSRSLRVHSFGRPPAKGRFDPKAMLQYNPRAAAL